MSILTDEKAFADLIEAVVEPNRLQLEKLAKRAKLIQVLFFSLFGFVLVGLGFFFYNIFTAKGGELETIASSFLIFFGLVFGSIVGIGVLTVFFKPGRGFKEIVVPKLLAYYGDLTFSAKPGPIADGLFGEGWQAENDVLDLLGVSDNGGLIKTELLPSYSYLQKSDQIQGHYRDRPIYMLDVSAIKRESSRSANGKSSSSQKTVFHGVMGCVTVPKKVSGRYALISVPSLHGLERVKLESPDFEKIFDFFGEDQIDGRKLMTPVQMEKWTEFARRMGKARVNLWFEGDRVWFAIQGIGDFLDRGILKGKAGALDDTVRDMAEDVEKVLAVVNFVQSDEMPEDVTQS